MDPKMEKAICDFLTVLLSRPVGNLGELKNGLIGFECLMQLDNHYFSTFAKKLFKNLEGLNAGQLKNAAKNNWEVIHSSMEGYLAKENFTDLDFELNVEQILQDDKFETFGYLISYFSVLLNKKRYVWNQTIGQVSDSDSYNQLKTLEANLLGGNEGEQVVEKEEPEQDENQKLVNMVTDLQNSLKLEKEKAASLKVQFDNKKDEYEETRKLLDQKSFDLEKMRLRNEQLEVTQKEYYDAIAIQQDSAKMKEKLKRLEKHEEDLEIENSFLRDKISEQDKKIRELKEIEGKYIVEEGMRKKFDMILERNESLVAEQRKKDLEMEGLKYQVEILKKAKEALENALGTIKNEMSKQEQEMSIMKEELKAKDQEIHNLDRIIVTLKDKLEVGLMTPTPSLSKKSIL